MSKSNASQSPTQKSNWRYSGAVQAAGFGESAGAADDETGRAAQLSTPEKKRTRKTRPRFSFSHRAVGFILNCPEITVVSVDLTPSWMKINRGRNNFGRLRTLFLVDQFRSMSAILPTKVAIQFNCDFYCLAQACALTSQNCGRALCFRASHCTSLLLWGCLLIDHCNPRFVHGRRRRRSWFASGAGTVVLPLSFGLLGLPWAIRG